MKKILGTAIMIASLVTLDWVTKASFRNITVDHPRPMWLGLLLISGVIPMFILHKWDILRFIPFVLLVAGLLGNGCDLLTDGIGINWIPTIRVFGIDWYINMADVYILVGILGNGRRWYIIVLAR